MQRLLWLCLVVPFLASVVSRNSIAGIISKSGGRITKSRPSGHCDMLCPALWMPVCASNGEIYNNACVFSSEQCRLKEEGKDIHMMASTEDCTGEKKDVSEISDVESRPVVGSKETLWKNDGEGGVVGFEGVDMNVGGRLGGTEKLRERERWGLMRDRDQEPPRPWPCPPGCMRWTDGCSMCECSGDGHVVGCEHRTCVWEGVAKCEEEVGSD